MFTRFSRAGSTFPTSSSSQPARGSEYRTGSMWERGLDIIFPPVCAGCGRLGRWICSACWVQVKWLNKRDCPLCGIPTTEAHCRACGRPDGSLASIISVAEFDGVPREAVHALKFHGRHAIAGLMGRLMADQARGCRVGALCAVPLHKKRRTERGYDQSALLARTASRELGVPFRVRALERIRSTVQQSGLGREERNVNVRGAFRAREAFGGESVLLVDDVFTTGATLEAAASALLEAGAGTVIGLVFASAE